MLGKWNADNYKDEKCSYNTQIMTSVYDSYGKEQSHDKNLSIAQMIVTSSLFISLQLLQ